MHTYMSAMNPHPYYTITSKYLQYFNQNRKVDKTRPNNINIEWQIDRIMT